MVLALGMVACARDAEAPAPVTVFAAASLAAPFEAIAKAFESSPGGRKVRLHTDGSQNLVLQIREGAAASVFASADEANMAKVVALSRVDGTPQVFARNRLAIVVKEGNDKGIRELADLARADLKVALCGPTVPVGNYARQALQKAGVTVTSVSDETSVKALVGKVQMGEIDAAIAYATDARSGCVAIPVAAEHDVVANYPIAVLTTPFTDAKGDRDAAAAFVAFVLGETGRAVLREHGFAVP